MPSGSRQWWRAPDRVSAGFGWGYSHIRDLRDGYRRVGRFFPRFPRET